MQGTELSEHENVQQTENDRPGPQFYQRVRCIWREWLSRRTRGKQLTWARFAEILRQYRCYSLGSHRPGRERGVTPEEPTAGNLYGGVREGATPDEPWWTQTGTKLETADTAKGSLQLTGTPLLGNW